MVSNIALTVLVFNSPWGRVSRDTALGVVAKHNLSHARWLRRVFDLNGDIQSYLNAASDVFNLGHGITPDVPVVNVERLSAILRAWRRDGEA